MQLAVHGIVGFAEILAALGVAHDDVGASRATQHVRRDSPGKGALLFPEKVLTADADPTASRRFHDLRDGHEGRAEDNLIAGVVAHQGQKSSYEFARL